MSVPSGREVVRILGGVPDEAIARAARKSPERSPAEEEEFARDLGGFLFFPS